MIRAADIIAKRKQKTSTVSPPPPANGDIFFNKLKLLDKKNTSGEETTKRRRKNSEKILKESKQLQKTSTTSHARRRFTDYKRVSISSKNKELPTIFTRASDTVDTLKKLSLGDCDGCPAAGYWDHMGPGKWCFHTAYFLGKPGKPEHCNSAKHNCPLSD